MSLQERYDRFYFEHGKCCAGCDWWHGINSKVGECTRRAPVAGPDRLAFDGGITSVSMAIPAGHIMTNADHVCGDFRDDFDWASLSLEYRTRIGCPSR